MEGLMPALYKAFDLLLVIGGFSLIIILHELGHFVAARWAGIRVLAFAVGFGPALVSFRKGLGWRKGSSEGEYKKFLATQAARATTIEGTPRTPYQGVSPTEYRINALPIFGGYVKMLGQDDADPAARSDEPDSFQRTPVWKRMIVISAGVAMNLLLAAVVFVVVFMIGLSVEPPRIGDVAPGSPAAAAAPTNAAALGVREVGLQPGDLITAVDGKPQAAFNDVAMAAIMAGRGSFLSIDVQRPDVAQTLHFQVEPRVDPASRMQQLGIIPDWSGQLNTELARQDADDFAKLQQKTGLAGISPTMHLVRAGGQPAQRLSDVSRAANRSGGEPIQIEFADGTSTASVSLRPRTDLQTAIIERPDKAIVPLQHLLGLLPVMQVEEVSSKEAKDAGLLPGDVFVQLGDIEWPSMADGTAQIRSHKGQKIRIAVTRPENGRWTLHELGEASVNSDGMLGIGLAEASRCSARLADWPADSPPHSVPPAERGTRIVAVSGVEVSDFSTLREALRRATAGAVASGGSSQVDVTLEPGIAVTKGDARTTIVHWSLGESDVRTLHSLGWENPLPAILFKPDEVLLKATGPAQAIAMGVDRTRSAMLSTYLTFVRLFQGTVKVEQLKGPVGIAHLGTLIAARGYVWLLFFLGLVSVNLAVINFLPMPIADGGHFVFLVYEQFAGKPPSIRFQNAAAIAGLVLIVGLFLVVTVNDIKHLFG